MNALELDSTLINDLLQGIVESYYCASIALGSRVLFLGQKSMLPFFASLDDLGDKIESYCLGKQSHSMNTTLPRHTEVDSIEALPKAYFDTIVCLENTPDDSLQQWILSIRPLLTTTGSIILSLPTTWLTTHYQNIAGAVQAMSNDAQSFSYASTPYHFFNLNNPWLIQIATSRYVLEKTLSWATCDQAFANFLLFIESTFTGRLPMRLSARILVTLQTTDGVGPQCRDPAPGLQDLDTPITEQTLAQTVTLPLKQWCEQLSGYLSYARNKIFFYQMITQIPTQQNIDISPYLSPEALQDIEQILLRNQLQEVTETILHTWHEQGDIEEILTFQGMQVGEALDYELITDLLTRFGAFKEE